MKRIFIFAFVLSVCVALPAYANSQSYNPIGKGCTNAFYIDKDCDGYGVASPLGVDADDNDPEVNTPETVIAKYGTLENFLHHLGYYPERIFYISTNGDDDTGEVNNIDKPYKTWDAVESQLQPGDAVIFKGGVYDYLGDYAVTCGDLNGTADKPIIIMAYPGEKAVIDSTESNIPITNSNYLIFDGFVLDNTQSSWGYGIGGYKYEHITFRNLEMTHHSSGMHCTHEYHILIENCVIHDNPQSHGIYLNSYHPPYSTDITIRNCLIYRNGRHGFQQNGIATNILFENNIVHSNALGGVSLINGIKDSIFRNNLIFNNNKQGFVLFAYDCSYSDEGPNSNNLFENNIVWLGKYNCGMGDSEPIWIPAIQFNDEHPEDLVYSGNIFRNNIFVSSGNPIFRFSQYKHFPSTIIENNIFYRIGGSDIVMSSPEGDWNLSTIESQSNLVKNNLLVDPKFTNVSIDYNLNPEKFNFDYLSNSSVRDFGTPVDAPSIDLRGNPRDENSDAGCYEYGWISANKPPIANAGEDIIVVDSDDDWKENITLNASQSYDQDGQIIHYLWYEKEEQLGNQKVITLPFSVGTHQVKLMTVDDKGALSYDMITVEVKPGPNVILLQNGWNEYTGTHICRISSQYPTYNYHNVDWAGDIGGGDSNIQRLIVRFDDLDDMLSSVSEDNEIVKAELRLYQIQRTDNIMGQSIKVFPLKKTFDPDTVCWNNSSSDDPWAVPGAYDENDVDMNSIAAVMMDEQNNIWREWNITNYVKALRNGTKQNYGLLLKQDNETADSSSSYKMPTDDEEALRPELVIHFQSLIQ